jgi:methyl-accepting chemotaxis protein
MVMTIRKKMFLLIVFAVAGFLIVIASAFSGIRQMNAARTLAETKSNLAFHLLEVKAYALSTILLDPSAESTFKIFRDAETRIRDNSQEVQRIADDAATRDAAARIASLWEIYDKNSHAIFQLYKTNPQGANTQLNEVYAHDFQPLQELLEHAVGSEEQAANAAKKMAEEAATATLWMVVLPLAALAVALLLFVWKLSRDLDVSLRNVFTALDQLGTGDLTTRLPVESKDEIAGIANAVNVFVGKTHDLVAQLHDGATRISEASSQLAVASSQIAADSREQSEAAASMAATVEQVTVSIGQVSDHAKDAYEVSQKSGQLSSQSSEVVHAASAEMTQISASVRDSSAVIQQLGMRSNEITAIVNTIKDIADQTNLLALNAAIEAARAGEQGRGFAVVADEVRKLAERTTHSTSEISGMIGKIQADTELAVKSMDEGVKRVDEGAVLAVQAEDSISQVKLSAEHVQEVMDNISAALREQSAASNDIATKVEQIAHMAEENDQAVQNNNAAVRAMEALAVSLKGSVALYKI